MWPHARATILTGMGPPEVIAMKPENPTPDAPQADIDALLGAIEVISEHEPHTSDRVSPAQADARRQEACRELGEEFELDIRDAGPSEVNR
ncbi:FIG00554086: hypothetical protein [Cronobacter dublinensis 1210]|uniref:Uncharacterized protein n=2 Tax=Cronobacter dublinensis TaxID=413497 RepID=A0ABM9QCH0_9ENTR|nr:FIG00554086: hypothetical protein [Cronobacter dublinensis 1210]